MTSPLLPTTGQTKRSSLRERCAFLLRSPERFAYWGSHIALRPYQEDAVKAVVQSIRNHAGQSFVWIFPRQSGKDEALALLVQYLLVLFSQIGGEIVFFNPTFKPQTETSMRRLEARLQANSLTNGRWNRRSGYIYQIGACSCTYMSADPAAHIVGATANRLLLVNEAQDIQPYRYDKDISPMVASVAGSKLFSGTRWTSNTLLEREYHQALEDEKKDGIRRVYFYTADDVRAVVPAYGDSVDLAIARMGRQHPLVKTQYFCEELDATAGMFSPTRLALMIADQSPQDFPASGQPYAFTLDVAGQDEARMQAGSDDAALINPGRDAACLSIIALDLSQLGTLHSPIYRVVKRFMWTGYSHVALFTILENLITTWHPMYIAMDATGVGEGLWSMLDHAHPKKVLPVKFSQLEKSEIGWRFLSIIETGRFRDCTDTPAIAEQYRSCQSEVLPGPGKLLRWGVPDGTRSATGELLHDDAVTADSLVAILDRQEWRPFTEPTVYMYKPPPLKKRFNF